MSICSQSTNKFETEVGMLNIAPTKISGQYKIVYDKNLKPWLDDYTGRRVALDTSISFLQQVANFLSVSTILLNTDCLRFGGFQRNLIKSWHIPFYFGTNPNFKELPKYFVLSQVPNETFDAEHIDNIYKFGVLLKVVDLEYIGLYNIINEINNEPYFDYPLYFNHEERTVKLFGYGIERQYPVQYTLNLTKAYSNQAYIDVINNKVLNAFAEQKMFYPRFLNIEFEFDFDYQTEQDFNNFYGFFSNKNIYTEDRLPYKNIQSTIGETIIEEDEISDGYFLKARIDQFVYDKSSQLGDYVSDGNVDYKSELKDYLITTDTGSVVDINEQIPQVRFRLTHINIGDEFRIYDGDEILFEYQVSAEDIRFDTMYELMVQLCKKMNRQSNLDFEFSCKILKTGHIEVIVKSNYDYDAIAVTDTKIELPIHMEIIENDEYFRGVGNNDVWLCGNQNLADNQDHLYINNILYHIVDQFKFNDYQIIRLIQDDELEYWETQQYDKITPVYVKTLTYAEIKQTYVEECHWLKPINFLTYYSSADSDLQGNFQLYIQSLIRTFGTNPTQDFINAIESFSGKKWEELISDIVKVKLRSAKESNQLNYSVILNPDTSKKEIFIDIDGIAVDMPIVNIQDIDFRNKQLYQYIQTNKLTLKLEDTKKLEVLYHNESLVKNMLFCSMGMTGYMTPNIFNIDRQFWLQNGCLDLDKQSSDLLRYTWFLLAGQQPEYLEGKHWRYMDEIETSTGEIIYRPRITSRLIRITDNLCETIFLGVKYQLPIQYEDWNFCVYLNYNDPEFINQPEYFVEVLAEEKLLMLNINKYVDFCDLIRGGKNQNKPLLDLSFFLNIKTSYNNSSDYYVDFKEVEIGNERNLILEPFYDKQDSTIYFLDEELPVKDWIHEYEGKKFFCLQTNSQNNLKNNFVESQDNSIFVTADIEYNGKKYTYQTMKLTFENCIQVNNTYMWFEDLKVTFFDTREIFLRNNNDEVIRVTFDILNKTNIVLPYQNSPKADADSVHKDAHKIVTLITDGRQEKFELLLPSNIKDNDRESRPISLKEDWFRVSKKITENLNGTEEININSESFVLTEEFKKYLLGLEQELMFDKSVYIGEYTLFDRNQIWRVIQDMIAHNVRFKQYTESQMHQELDKFSLDYFFNLPNKSIKIKNASFDEFSDNYVVINPYNIDKNYVIWEIDDTFGEKNRICKINRHNAPYIPYIPLQQDIKKFQINKFQVNNTLWNLYDEAFGGIIENTNIPISGTTLWQEVQGNLISTLFCKNDNIILSTPYPTDNIRKVDYYELLKKIIDYNKIIITSDNQQYIESLNKNVKPYIIETYAQLLLKEFYILDTVTGNSGLRINYTVDSKKPYTIYVPNKYTLGVRYQNLTTLTITLVRR